MSHPGNPQSQPGIEIRERGAPRDGQPQWLDRRLFMRLTAFEAPAGSSAAAASARLAQSLTERRIEAVIYADVNHPLGFAVVALAEDPGLFTGSLREAESEVITGFGLRVNTDFSMLGRTYSTGFEPDLAFWLLERPRQTLLEAAWDWAVWYPLRRRGPFERLEGRERGAILKEHAEIGRAYGEHDLAHDIRLCCHGLDPNDNDFVIGLIGKDLYPLSHVVSAMRRTRQTAEFIEHMGPFFVGRVIHRIAAK